MDSFSQLFTRNLLAANPAFAVRFREWSWEPGMGFHDTGLWWGEAGKRITPHEGIDLVRYYDESGAVQDLTGPLAVPINFSGELVRTHRDFLAWSLYIKHPQFVRSGYVLHTVFGHMLPGKREAAGQRAAAGEVVGSLEKYQQNKTVPLHLHFTIAWIAETVAPEELNWQLLNDSRLVTLVDPRSDCSLVCSSPGPFPSRG